MAIEDTVKEAKQSAENEAKRLGFTISSLSLKEIEDELVRNTQAIEKSLITEEKTYADLDKGVKKLIDEASALAKKAERTTIYYSDIKAVFPKICPAYWPFC